MGGRRYQRRAGTGSITPGPLGVWELAQGSKLPEPQAAGLEFLGAALHPHLSREQQGPCSPG